MRFENHQIDHLLEVGSSVYDSNGDRVGSLGRIYLDDQTDEATWATVNTGFFGLSESFVPLRDARLAGDELHVAHVKEQIKEAPRVEEDEHLSAEDEVRLYEYYGIAVQPVVNDSVVTDDIAGVDPVVPVVAPGRDIVEPVSDLRADSYTNADHGDGRGAAIIDDGRPEGYTTADHGSGAPLLDDPRPEGYTYADHGEGAPFVHKGDGGYTSNDPTIGDDIPGQAPRRLRMFGRQQESGASPQGGELL